MKNVYTVTQINSYIKNMFTQDYMLRMVYIKGEVSNCKYHTSGHIYFTLKDSGGIINCVMFSGSRGGLSFNLSDGQMVVAGGTVDVYGRDGKYQLYAKSIILDGTGLLYEKYELLRRELDEMGMFSKEYKQPIPSYIKMLGVVTAPTGAAVRDIINVATRRNPYIQIILYPAIVQGDMASESIINGIHALEALKVDVMIVGRGGGSIEDLWAFNEREVVQAVFDCSVPVISAVGHETDTTIVDFVADMRAPTPSAAAELAVFEFSKLEERLETYKSALNYRLSGKIDKNMDRLSQYRLKMKYLNPVIRTQDKRTYAMELEEKLQKGMLLKISGEKHKMALFAEKLKGLSPVDKLCQGYSYVENETVGVVNDVDKVNAGDLLRIYVRNGVITANVIEKTKQMDIKMDINKKTDFIR